MKFCRASIERPGIPPMPGNAGIPPPGALLSPVLILAS